MSYQVPQHIDPNKVFLINHSELEGRLDSDFYNPSYYQIFGSDKVKWVRLKSVIKNLKHPPEYKRVFATEGYQLIRSQNVRPTGINLSESPVFLADEVVQSPSAIFPHVNDILIVRSGVNAGDVAVIEEEYQKVTIGADTLLLNVTQDVMPKFVQIYFMTEIGRKQLNRHITGATNKHLNSYSLKRVYFPKVNLLTQSNCVSIIESAFVENNRKQEQAKALLQSIDDYLLGELGIQLPETKSQTIQDRMFVVNFSEVSGDRLDVEYNNPHKHGAILKVLKNAKYPTALLSFLAKDIFQGVGKDETEDSTYVLLKVKNILRGNMIDYSDVEFVKSVPQNKLLLRNDIISPFIGEAVRQIKFSLFDKEEYRYTVDNNTGVIRLNESVNAQYVCEYLCSCLGKMQIERLIGGGGVPFLGSSGAKKLNIIIPPLQKQQEIVDHLSSIRQQAKALQEEGKTILEQAKKEVEQMIIEK